jgi:hypothetical protein
MRKLKLAALLFLFLPVLQAQQPLSNESVVKMVKAGLSADIVAATVNSQPGRYDLSPEALIALKQAGASDKVISAMIAHNSSATSSPAGASSGAFGSLGGTDTASPNGVPAGVDSVGFYYKDKDGNWAEVNAEVVNFKTGGALKHIGSAGIVKGDLNGHVAGFHSRLAIQPPASFILYAPEGVSPGEYQLIRFRSNSDSREFRSLTGGVAHTSGGADRDTAEFTSRKLAPHVYEITLNADIGKGEYGFLPPLETSGGKSISSSGKIYTFSFAQ